MHEGNESTAQILPSQNYSVLRDFIFHNIIDELLTRAKYTRTTNTTFFLYSYEISSSPYRDLINLFPRYNISSKKKQTN